MIHLINVDKYYSGISGNVHALKSFSLDIEKGQHVAVVGKSGSGKSTLLNIISGIDRPTMGNVIVNGANLNSLKENELALWRGRNVGIVFQFYQLLPTISALDNVLFAMELVNKIPRKERLQKAQRHLSEVGLAEKARKLPNELSGGERQRVAVARSMANSPDIIIADEPTGNLDTKTGAQIIALFGMLNKTGTTIITVTHSERNDSMYDQIIYIEDGLLINTNPSKCHLQ